MLSLESHRVLEHAMLAQRGREVCGFLMSDTEGRQHVFLVRNWSGEGGAFFVSISENRRAERYACQRDLTIAAFLHSHKTSLELSDADRQCFEKSCLPWVVICLRERELRYRVYPRGSIKRPGGRSSASAATSPAPSPRPGAT